MHVDPMHGDGTGRMGGPAGPPRSARARRPDPEHVRSHHHDQLDRHDDRHDDRRHDHVVEAARSVGDAVRRGDGAALDRALDRLHAVNREAHLDEVRRRPGTRFS